MAEGNVSSGIKIEVSSSNSSLLTMLMCSEVAKTCSSKDEFSKSISKSNESEEVSIEVEPS